MYFYYNPELNMVSDEECLISDLMFQRKQYPIKHRGKREVIRQELRTKREVDGWFECQASIQIRAGFSPCGLVKYKTPGHPYL